MGLYNCCINFLKKDANFFEIQKLLVSYRTLNKILLKFDFSLELDEKKEHILIKSISTGSDIIRKGTIKKYSNDIVLESERLIIYNSTINELDKLFKIIGSKLLEAIFWRYIDNSKINRKIPSDRELAGFLGIHHDTFYNRYIKGITMLEKLNKGGKL